MKTIAVLTSGGDAPGMNACLRAVVRTAVHEKLNVFGVRYGYDGLIAGDFLKMDSRSVANIIHRGGTILKTARSQKFLTIEGRQQAKTQLEKHNIEGIIVIGGDGTFRGAVALSEICNIPIVGCPGTIDNDLFGTDFTIGYDTAINTVIEAVDKIRDTAESHNRVFIVEVMGRDAGLIALYSGIGSGAEGILIPETKNDMEVLLKRLEEHQREKHSRIIIVAEGDEVGGAFQLEKKLHEKFPEFDIRVSILGHVQRGGSPTCMERVNASRIGFAAIQTLLEGKSQVMIGIVDRKIKLTPFKDAVKQLAEPDPQLMKMVDILAR